MSYNTYNQNAPYGGDYNVKNPAELGLTTNIQTTAAFTQTILGIGDKYAIDLYGSLMTWQAEDTPLLSILYGLGSETAAPPYIVWNDEYRGTSWIDIGLDENRMFTVKNSAGTNPTTSPLSGYATQYDGREMPVDPTAAAYEGGMYKFSGTVANAALASLNLTGTDDPNISVATTYSTPFSGAVCFPIVMNDTNKQGRIANIYNRIRQLAVNLRYERSGSGTREAYIFKAADTYNPLYFAFDDVYFSDGTSTVYHKAEVLMRIEAVVYDSASGGNLAIFLNKAQSNHNLASMTEMLISNNHKYGSAKFAGLVSHPSRMIQVGEAIKAPTPIAEGDNFAVGGNFTFHRERKENYSQIFASPKYGITGTVQASKFRFGDDFAATREFWLRTYKGWKTAAYLRGSKGETVTTGVGTTGTIAGNAGASTMIGQPVRQLGGLLDYSLFPITYMKKALPTAAFSSTNEQTAVALSNWLSDLANSLMAFRINGSRNLTFLVSQAILDKLDMYVRITQASKFLGGEVMIQKPSQLTYGLEIYTFKTSRGIQVNFVHEPALDYMIEFPTAYHQFGKASINPREIMLSIDTNNIKQVICRPDKVEGNIQDPGQDAFLEGMRGESSFKLRFPKNHAVIWVPES